MTPMAEGNGSCQLIPASFAGRGLWMVSTNHAAHFYPDACVTAEAGLTSACLRWTSTTLDAVEGPVTHWCPACREITNRDPRQASNSDPGSVGTSG